MFAHVIFHLLFINIVVIICKVTAALFCIDLFSVAEFGLFFTDEDQKKGIWLENNRNLEYYLLRTGVSCCFRWRFIL